MNKLINKFNTLFKEYLIEINDDHHHHKHCDGSYELRKHFDMYNTYKDYYYIKFTGYIHDEETADYNTIEECYEEGCILLKNFIKIEKRQKNRNE